MKILIPDDMADNLFMLEIALKSRNHRVVRAINGKEALGLAISKAYIEMMGGRIWLKSSPGEGSTFSFSIPYTPAKLPEHSVEILIRQMPELSGPLTAKMLWTKFI